MPEAGSVTVAKLEVAGRIMEALLARPATSVKEQNVKALIKTIYQGLSEAVTENDL